MNTFTVEQGDCLTKMAALNADSIDAIVTDPPYGLSQHKVSDVEDCLKAWLVGETYSHGKKGFMGKGWDGWVPGPNVWREAYRVLKPGGHMLVFAGSRTQDLMGLGLRLAGFEIRDSIQWLYGTGFPKSLDIGKAVAAHKTTGKSDSKQTGTGAARDRTGQHWSEFPKAGKEGVGKPSDPEWEGWGTALKPSHEPVFLVRKPLIGTVAANVLEHGTGGLNIDGSRIKTDDPLCIKTRGAVSGTKDHRGTYSGGDLKEIKERFQTPGQKLGRWPPNVILSEQAAGDLDEQSGILKSGGGDKSRKRPTDTPTTFSPDPWGVPEPQPSKPSEGGASRFFYCAKASTSEKAAGLEGKCPHPTVKPLALMRYLVKLITPPGGLVLDPFTGSGSTGCAAVQEGFSFLGFELDPNYVEVARQRIEFWASVDPADTKPTASKPKAPKPAKEDNLIFDLFGFRD